MGYPIAMVTIVPLLAALFGSVATSAAALPVTVVGEAAAASSTATRFSGASVAATVTARIVRTSARVGAGLGPPAPLMQPRNTTVTAADGAAIPALVYDFE